MSHEDFIHAMEDAGGAVLEEESLLSQRFGYYRVVLRPGAVADEVIPVIAASGTASHIERNYVIEATDLPNDPHYGELWGLQKIGAEEA